MRIIVRQARRSGREVICEKPAVVRAHISRFAGTHAHRPGLRLIARRSASMLSTRR
jgi:hypothetical protein